jgi:hypothetical protein
MLDLVALDTAMFARLATDSQGAQLRAALGGAGLSGPYSGVMVADDLIRQEVGRPALQLPSPPFLALRRLGVPITDRIAWLPSYIWYCYGSLAAGSWALSALPPLIDSAYQGFTPGGIGSIEIGVQAPTPDSVLGLWVLPVSVNLSGI